MFKKVCIIGCGLIGSSLARAIKKKNLADKLVSSNRSEKINKKVIQLKIVDDSSADTKRMVVGSDLIVIATPLSSYKDVILKIKDSLKDGAILTDVGSVKKVIFNLVDKNIPKTFLGFLHIQLPGQKKVDLNLDFRNYLKIDGAFLLQAKKAKKKDINSLKVFWKKVGSKVDTMETKQHDFILSITSHIPHLIAYNIVNTSLDIQDKKKSSIVKYSAGGLRDFTRIAASNPIMWRDIFIQNKANNTKMINKFIANLKDLKKAIQNEDGKKLEKIFAKTKKIRKDIVDAGQDVEKADFGRK